MTYQETILLNKWMDADGVRCAWRDIVRNILLRVEEARRSGKPVFLGLKTFGVDPKTVRKAMHWIKATGLVAMTDAVGWRRKAEAVPEVNWKVLWDRKKEVRQHGMGIKDAISGGAAIGNTVRGIVATVVSDRREPDADPFGSAARASAIVEKLCEPVGKRGCRHEEGTTSRRRWGNFPVQIIGAGTEPSVPVPALYSEMYLPSETQQKVETQPIPAPVEMATLESAACEEAGETPEEARRRKIQRDVCLDFSQMGRMYDNLGIEREIVRRMEGFHAVADGVSQDLRREAGWRPPADVAACSGTAASRRQLADEIRKQRAIDADRSGIASRKPSPGETARQERAGNDVSGAIQAEIRAADAGAAQGGWWDRLAHNIFRKVT